MGHEYAALAKIQYVLGHFIKFGCILDHGIGNSGKSDDEIGDRLLRIEEGDKLINKGIAVVFIHRNLCDFGVLRAPSSGFNINDDKWHVRS